MLKIGVLIAGFNFIIVHSLNERIEVLTNNFFENLQGDPNLLVDNVLSSGSKQFIDKQIKNYVKLVTNGELSSVKKKRSLLDQVTKDITGTYLLSGITPSVTIPARFPLDILFFQQSSGWYAAALESSEIKRNADNLVIYQYVNQTFNEKARVAVVNGVKIAHVNIANFTLIAVAENDTSKENFDEKSRIYQFDAFGLVKIQSIDMHYATDVAMWRIHNEVYMSIAQFTSNKTGNVRYELEIPIYKWLGKHFDLVQTIKGKGARTITPFTINHAHFLAIANFRNDKGKTKIYSEIYKYDYHSEKYEVYQRILTGACTDIKFFTFGQNNRKKDSFLVVANSYEEDSDGNVDYETDSILYKFVDDYFIPFQSFRLEAVEKWLPVGGPNGEFILFASSRYEGLKSFQYDGWTFQEVPQETSEILTGTGIKSVRSTIFNDTLVIVVANKNNPGNLANVFNLNFTHHDTLSQVYDDMVKWCEKGLEKVEELSGGGLFDAILGDVERADIDEEAEMDEIDDEIDSLNLQLEQLEFRIQEPLDLPEGNITAHEIIFNGVTTIHNLETSEINGFDAEELMDNVLDIEQGFELDEIEFESLKIDGSLTPETINGRDPSTLVHHHDDLNIDQLVVLGKLIVPSLEIKGKLNGVSVDEQNLLLNVGDQNLSKPITVDEIWVDTMTAETVNGQKLVPTRMDELIYVDHLQNLTVTNLTIGGYINDVDIPTLDKYALKKSGDQEITGDYTFDSLEGNNLEVEGLISGRKLSDLIPTSGGNFTINQDMIFKNRLTVNNLKVLDFLNEIDVEDGKLDVLLKNHPEEQRVTGEKSFDDLIIYNAIRLQGNIKSEELEKMNPVVTMDDDVVLDGDRTITGNVQVENIVSIGDMVTPDGAYSLSKLKSKGLRLTEKEIRPRLNFVQQLNVDEIFVDTINGRDPSSFVVNGAEEPQIIQGLKTFTGDLHITGPTNAFKINDVIVSELENVLKVEGDQIVGAKHHFKHVIVDDLVANATKFGASTLDDRFRGDTTGAVVINGDLELDSIVAKTVTVKGLVNDLDFDAIVKDTVTKNTLSMISGHKFFENLTVDNLEVQDGIEMAEVKDLIKELRLKGPLKLKNPIEITNLYFDKTCNGIDKANFGKEYVDENGHQIVIDNHIFDTITVYGNTFIGSNKINHVGLDDLAENTVKVDEPFEFDTVIFESDIVSKDPVVLGGHIENVDLDNLVLSNLDHEQIIMDEKVFLSNLTINGSTHFDGFINGINLTQFCSFGLGDTTPNNLIVDGNAYFVKGPNVAQINNVSVQDIWDNAWFSDRDTTLSGHIEFDDVIFEKDINIGGFVDNVSLKLLSENYFSKSRDQRVTATFTFLNDLVFENNISVPEITLNGDLNGINLDEFVRTALLNDYDQVFETVLFLENCTIANLTGEFTVNDLDLERDVMRYDKINMVTGPKFFQNLNVDSLKIDKNIKIQGVDVLEWFKNSVLKSTSFNITGTKSLRNAIFANGFQLGGTLNGLKFDVDHVMVRNLPQNITGKKTITTSHLDPVVFKAIKLKGLLNDIDVSDLINNQAYKNRDNTFKTELNLHNNITTDNVVIEKTFRGVNMSELIANVTNLGALNNLLEQYNKLLAMSYKLEGSIRAQAYFVHHYEIIQTIPLITNSRMIQCPDHITRIGTVVPTENQGFRIDLYGWHTDGFLHDASINYPGKELSYVNQVLMGRYIYAEENDGTGRFFTLDSSMHNIVTIPTNNTRATTSFIAPSTREACTLFIYYDCAPKIYCEDKDNVRLMQTLGTSNCFQGSSVTIKDTLYLIVIDQPSDGVESHIALWRFDNGTNEFAIHQSMFEAEPRSIATAHFHGSCYLAIASGHLQNAIYSGRVELRRFDEQTRQFRPWQSLELDAPIQVEFSILPSNELVLYVLTDNPTEPLLVYRYEGIAGFKLRVVGSTLPKISYINQLMGAADQHFIVGQSYDEINVIKVIFKGEKVDNE